MQISGQLKGIFSALILLTLILIIVPQFLPDIMTPAEAVSDNTSYPTIIRTVFGLWWVPIGLLMIGVILSATKGRGRSRRRR